VKGCLVEDCKRPHKAKGCCNLHYQRLKKWGDPTKGEKCPQRIKSTATEKWCPDCKEFRPHSAFYHSAGNYDTLSVYCKHHQAVRSNIRRRQVRFELLEHLGGKCVHCGFSDWRALQVDHVNGGGRQEYHNGYSTNSVKYLKKVVASPGAYQLLCANCNWIKKYENNEI
jgi:hypothetical protein